MLEGIRTFSSRGTLLTAHRKKSPFTTRRPPYRGKKKQKCSKKEFRRSDVRAEIFPNMGPRPRGIRGRFSCAVGWRPESGGRGGRGLELSEQS